MTRFEFEQMVLTYGADTARWPEDITPAGHAFMSKNPDEARELLTAEESLDAALDMIIAPAPSDLLKKRILNTAQVNPAHDTRPARTSGYLHWRSAAALVVAAFGLGFGGANLLPPSETNGGSTYAQADTDWQDAADDLGLSDTYAWVEGDNADGY
jgi:hypothetical protein